MERLPGPSEAGSVVLDIGGEVGAAVVYTSESLAGNEIEIRRLGEVWDGRHVAVRARHVPTGTLHAAVFEALDCGYYEVRVRGDAAVVAGCAFEVEGGRVVEHYLTLPLDM